MGNAEATVGILGMSILPAMALCPNLADLGIESPPPPPEEEEDEVNEQTSLTSYGSMTMSSVSGTVSGWFGGSSESKSPAKSPKKSKSKR